MDSDENDNPLSEERSSATYQYDAGYVSAAAQIKKLDPAAQERVVGGMSPQDKRKLMGYYAQQHGMSAQRNNELAEVMSGNQYGSGNPVQEYAKSMLHDPDVTHQDSGVFGEVRGGLALHGKALASGYQQHMKAYSGEPAFNALLESASQNTFGHLWQQSEQGYRADGLPAGKAFEATRKSFEDQGISPQSIKDDARLNWFQAQTSFSGQVAGEIPKAARESLGKLAATSTRNTDVMGFDPMNPSNYGTGFRREFDSGVRGATPTEGWATDVFTGMAREALASEGIEPSGSTYDRQVEMAAMSIMKPYNEQARGMAQAFATGAGVGSYADAPAIPTSVSREWHIYPDDSPEERTRKYALKREVAAKLKGYNKSIGIGATDAFKGAQAGLSGGNTSAKWEGEDAQYLRDEAAALKNFADNSFVPDQDDSVRIHGESRTVDSLRDRAEEARREAMANEEIPATYEEAVDAVAMNKAHDIALLNKAKAARAGPEAEAAKRELEAAASAAKARPGSRQAEGLTFSPVATPESTASHEVAQAKAASDKVAKRKAKAAASKKANAAVSSSVRVAKAKADKAAAEEQQAWDDKRRSEGGPFTPEFPTEEMPTFPEEHEAPWPVMKEVQAGPTVPEPVVDVFAMEEEAARIAKDFRVGRRGPLADSTPPPAGDNSAAVLAGTLTPMTEAEHRAKESFISGQFGSLTLMDNRQQTPGWTKDRAALGSASNAYKINNPKTAGAVGLEAAGGEFPYQEHEVPWSLQQARGFKEGQLAYTKARGHLPFSERFESPVDRGNRNEERIAAAWKDASGRGINTAGVGVDEKFPGLGASPDGLYADGKGLVEYKNPAEFYGIGTEKGQKNFAQMQYQMNLLGREYADWVQGVEDPVTGQLSIRSQRFKRDDEYLEKNQAGYDTFLTEKAKGIVDLGGKLSDLPQREQDKMAEAQGRQDQRIMSKRDVRNLSDTDLDRAAVLGNARAETEQDRRLSKVDRQEERAADRKRDADDRQLKDDAKLQREVNTAWLAALQSGSAKGVGMSGVRALGMVNNPYAKAVSGAAMGGMAGMGLAGELVDTITGFTDKATNFGADVYQTQGSNLALRSTGVSEGGASSMQDKFLHAQLMMQKGHTQYAAEMAVKTQGLLSVEDFADGDLVSAMRKLTHAGKLKGWDKRQVQANAVNAFGPEAGSVFEAAWEGDTDEALRSRTVAPDEEKSADAKSGRFWANMYETSIFGETGVKNWWGETVTKAAGALGPDTNTVLTGFPIAGAVVGGAGLAALGYGAKTLMGRAKGGGATGSPGARKPMATRNPAPSAASKMSKLASAGKMSLLGIAPHAVRMATGSEDDGGLADSLLDVADWTAGGAALGSVVPGVGTAIGAGVGAAIGIGNELYESFSDSDEDMRDVTSSISSPVQAAALERQMQLVTIDVNLNINQDGLEADVIVDGENKISMARNSRQLGGFSNMA